LTARA